MILILHPSTVRSAAITLADWWMMLSITMLWSFLTAIATPNNLFLFKPVQKRLYPRWFTEPVFTSLTACRQTTSRLALQHSYRVSCIFWSSEQVWILIWPMFHLWNFLSLPTCCITWYKRFSHFKVLCDLVADYTFLNHTKYLHLKVVNTQDKNNYRWRRKSKWFKMDAQNLCKTCAGNTN